MKRGLLLVRADATVHSGTGHVMRCLALAQAWQREGDVMFAMAQSTPAIANRLRSEKIRHISIEAAPGSDHDLDQTVASAALHNAEWMVVDGYHFSANYVSRVQDACPLLLIDDNAELNFYGSRFVLNQNLDAGPEMYAKRAPQTHLLLGSSYTLLREEFTPHRNVSRTISEQGERILLTMGGSDPKNLAPGIVAALAELPINNLQIRVVVGGSAENRAAVQAVAERFSDRVEVQSDVTDMAKSMAWADVAIAGAGTTCWEMCLLGLPAVLIVVAENQRGIAEHLATVGAAFHAGSAEFISYSALAQLTAGVLANREQRVNLSRAARKLVDGLGSERVRAALQDRELNLRTAQEGDRQLLFDWASDAVSRSASFHSHEISWQEHESWFAERFQDQQSVIYIGENAAGEPIGLVRFQILNRNAIVSINVAPKFRGKGWGRELIVFGTNSLARERFIQKFEAFVKPKNDSSARLFRSCGFKQIGIKKVSGQDALRFIFEVGSETHAS